MYVAENALGLVGDLVDMNRFPGNPDIAITAGGESISLFLRTLVQPI